MQLYFIQGGLSKRIKIGISNDPEDRLKELQTGSPEALAILGTMVGGSALEHQLHTEFGRDRLHREWFRESPELLDYIAAHCPQAEKREYLPITGSSYRVWPIG